MIGENWLIDKKSKKPQNTQNSCLQYNVLNLIFTASINCFSCIFSLIKRFLLVYDNFCVDKQEHQQIAILIEMKTVDRIKSSRISSYHIQNYYVNTDIMMLECIGIIPKSFDFKIIQIAILYQNKSQNLVNNVIREMIKTFIQTFIYVLMD